MHYMCNTHAYANKHKYVYIYNKLMNYVKVIREKQTQIEEGKKGKKNKKMDVFFIGLHGR